MLEFYQEQDQKLRNHFQKKATYQMWLMDQPFKRIAKVFLNHAKGSQLQVPQNEAKSLLDLFYEVQESTPLTVWRNFGYSIVEHFYLNEST